MLALEIIKQAIYCWIKYVTIFLSCQTAVHLDKMYKAMFSIWLKFGKISSLIHLLYKYLGSVDELAVFGWVIKAKLIHK